MAQAGNFTQPPQQLYRQVLDAAGSSETGRLYRFAGDCGEAALAPAAAEVKQALSGLPGRMQRHLFASFIELFQNVDRYGARIADEEAARPYGEIDICRTPDGGASIHAVNLIPAAARDRLEAILSELQRLGRGQNLYQAEQQHHHRQ